MAKRLTEKQKEEILNSFNNGKNIDELSHDFNCNKLTISRNLKKALGEEKYKELIKKNKLNNKNNIVKNQINKDSNSETLYEESIFKEVVYENMRSEDNLNFNTFTEITPLDQEIENIPRKDLSSISISDIDFPKIVYMIVSDKIDLDIKLLRDYPQWNFLSESELSRKTLEIFIELKNAKRFCRSNQKVIKIPNTKVFQIVAPILVSRGISRMVFEENLIAL